MMVPRIHLNGTAKSDLTTALELAYRALMSAKQALVDTCPHARDYYIISDTAYQQARTEYLARLKDLETVQDELLTLYTAIQDGKHGNV